MSSDDQAQPKRDIDNRMEDCGDGRHVGWWSENHLWPSSLLIEVNQSVIISCCEGERAEKRITFITSRTKGIEIIRAAAKALGLECPIMSDDRSQAIPQWTEGVCGDGAVILRDGIMVPITEVLFNLNHREALLAAWKRLPAEPEDRPSRVSGGVR